MAIPTDAGLSPNGILIEYIDDTEDVNTKGGRAYNAFCYIASPDKNIGTFCTDITGALTVLSLEGIT